MVKLVDTRNGMYEDTEVTTGHLAILKDEKGVKYLSEKIGTTTYQIKEVIKKKS